MTEEVVDGLREGTGQIAKALAAAQAAFPAVGKDKTAAIKSEKGNFSYSYADLASILAAVRKPLADNQLAITQPIIWSEGHAWLATRLLHVSGQSLESLYPLKQYDRPQEMGSALTYARRYSLTALLGIAAEEDDDGAAAQGGTPTAEEKPRSAPPKRTAPAGDLVPCPLCKTPTPRSKYPSAGKTHGCPNCGHTWEPGK